MAFVSVAINALALSPTLTPARIAMMLLALLVLAVVLAIASRRYWQDWIPPWRKAALDPARKHWLHVATGEVAVGERVLVAGDALGFDGEAGELALRGIGDSSDVLLFDLPL